MDFINDNYVWLIVIGVILFMALIGYIAEKTDFGRSQFEKKVKREPKPKKEKAKKEPKKAVEELPIEAPFSEEGINEPVVIEDDDWMKPLEGLVDPMENETIEEDLTVSLNGVDSEAEEDLTPQLDSVEPVVEEDLTVQLNGVEPVVEEDLTTQLNSIEPAVEEDLNVPFGDSFAEPVVNQIEEPVEAIKTNVFNETTEELTPPNIDTLNKDDDEEDVWKF